MSEEYDLKKSENGIGQLYPILEAKDGEVIDGFHREQADKNWKRVRLEHIDTEEKKLIARLVANFARREITKKEKAKWINGLAEIYKEQGLQIRSQGSGKNEIIERIEQVTGIQIATIQSFLKSEYKQKEPEQLKEHEYKLSAEERIESRLGKDYAERFRKQVLEEEKLSPQERAALTKKREHEKEERKQKHEENKRKKEEKLQKQAEETARQKLLKDKDFIADAARLAPLIEQPEVQEEPEPISENSQQLTSFLTNYAKALKKNPYPQVETDEVQTAINFFKRLLEKDKIHCPICGERHLQWRCGHEF